jgi:hypothetical protein
MQSKSYKRSIALILAFACLAFAACQAPAEQEVLSPELNDAPSSQGGVYAEQTLDLSALQYIGVIRALEDGTIAGIGSTPKGTDMMFRLDEVGRVTNTVELTAASDDSVFCINSIGASGDYYVHEIDDISVIKRYSADWKAISSVELEKPDTSAAESANPHMDMIQSFGVDEDAGLAYITTRTQTQIFDLSTGKHLKTIESQLMGMNNLTIMEAGNVCEFSYGDDSSFVLRCYNPVTGVEKWSASSTEYPENIVYNPQDKKLYARFGRKVAGIDESGMKSTLVELSDFSVMSPFVRINDLVVGKDGAVYCLLSEETDRDRMLAAREQALTDMEAILESNPEATIEELSPVISPDTESSRFKFVRIALADAASIPPVQEITVSITRADSGIMAMASAFHAANPGARGASTANARGRRRKA